MGEKLMLGGDLSELLSDLVRLRMLLLELCQPHSLRTRPVMGGTQAQTMPRQFSTTVIKSKLGEDNMISIIYEDTIVADSLQVTVPCDIRGVEVRLHPGQTSGGSGCYSIRWVSGYPLSPNRMSATYRRPRRNMMHVTILSLFDR
jgi:hypothetical protein